MKHHLNAREFEGYTTVALLASDNNKRLEVLTTLPDPPENNPKVSFRVVRFYNNFGEKQVYSSPFYYDAVSEYNCLN